MILLQLLLLFLAIISYYSALSTADKRDFIIVQSANVSCPTQPCFILNEYASVVQQHHLDNATFNFLPGNHHLDTEIRLENISDVQFLISNEVQDENVIIHLSPLGSIQFVNCDNIQISGLVLVLHESSTESGSFLPRSSLIFHRTTASLSELMLFGNGTFHYSAIKIHTSQMKISNVTVSGTRGVAGAALYAFQSTVNFYGQNVFSDNNASQYNNISLGGAMSLWQCTFNFFGRISFIDNIAVSDNIARGGAIYSENSTLLFSGSAFFLRNVAFSPSAFQYAKFEGDSTGGAIAVLASILKFGATSNISFINNGAMFKGGAILVNSAKLQIQGSALFEANSAKHGGAIAGERNSWIYCSGRSIKFRNNTGISNGGAMFVIFSKLVRLEKVLFEDNKAVNLGGALTVTNSNLHISTAVFVNNNAFLNAGAVYISNGIFIFDGVNHFEKNHAHDSAAVDVFDASVIFSGENEFLNNNSTLDCGCLGLSFSTVLISGRSAFYSNYGIHGGAIKSSKSELTISGNISFMSNTANLYGGAIMSFFANLSIIGQASFVNNRAKDRGTAIFVLNSDLKVDGNVTISGGYGFNTSTTEGAIYLLNSTAFFVGVLSLGNNSGFNGGGIFSKGSTLTVDFDGCNQYIDNQAVSSGGGLYALNSEIILRGDCSSFQSNTAQDGGAIYAQNSLVHMTGTQNFMWNSATRGGALSFYSNSKLILMEPFCANFVENQAKTHGGAIFFDDRSYNNVIQCIEPIYKGECLIELNSTTDIQLNFVYNVAGSAGTVLYGGGFDTCRLYIGEGIFNSCGNRIGGSYNEEHPIDVIQNISNIVSDDNVTSKIASEPLKVCFCETFGLECNIHRDEKIQIVRGKEFTLLAVTLGQNKGIVPSYVRASLSNDVEISAKQRIQSTEKYCTPITYRLFTENNKTKLRLFPDGPCRDNDISSRDVDIDFLPCPDGFTLVRSECVCEDRLQQYTTNCSVDDSSIERSSNTFWMGTVYYNETFEGLILHSGCPFDYCMDTPVSIQLDNLNIQCNHNHSGTLCGSCNDNYSIAFGTLHCLPCSNNYLALILPFAVAGVALVVILLLLRLSVASGTLNGLIFYANVIQLNHPIFFPPGKTNILTVFIAWLNLDLGIETCFYDGMNIYAFTWLQFLFPFYVWFLIGMIIVMSRYSNKIARSLGNNPVAALATLFLLSYSKILRTIITALSFTSLEYPDGTNKLVWLYDGNVPYFQRADHIVLGVFAIIALLFLFLPYTFLLLCGQWLQAFSDWRILSWLNKIMPFMDAYNAPYRKNSRYWTGFVLLVRCALFLTFSFNILGNASVNLLAITSVTAALAASAWIRKRVYIKLYNDILEVSFIFNLCILAAATYHVKETGGSQAKLANTSVGIVFATFICIVLYHVFLRLQKTAAWKKLPEPNLRRYFTLHRPDQYRKCNTEDSRQHDNATVKLPTTITIDLNELLLDI